MAFCMICKVDISETSQRHDLQSIDYRVHFIICDDSRCNESAERWIEEHYGRTYGATISEATKSAGLCRSCNRIKPAYLKAVRFDKKRLFTSCSDESCVQKCMRALEQWNRWSSIVHKSQTPPLLVRATKTNYKSRAVDRRKQI